MSTYGEFIDSVEKTEFFGGKLFIEEWKALATKEQWKEYRQMNLRSEEVICFAEDMGHYYRELINGTCTESLYYDRIKEGHAFLKEVHQKANDLGIDVNIKEIDQFLTMLEPMIASGVVEVKESKEE